MITQETRKESFQKVLIDISKRREQCLTGLKTLKQATANELAMYLYSQNIIPHFNRNFVHPRLNELVDLNEVQIIGKKFDTLTNRNCAVYTIK